jgi:hypothetical protein
MFQLSNLKLITLAAIYVLHISFFDTLMGGGFKDLNVCSLSATAQQSQSKSSSTTESSYRLLTKHEQSKQAVISLPDFQDFLSATFTTPIEEHIQQPLSGAFAHVNESSFKLYRLYRVFLI